MVTIYLDSGSPKGLQYPIGPLIYLYHWAVMNLAENWLDRFAAAFRRAGATLALSFVNIGQLLKVTADRFEMVCRLYREVHHDYVFTQANPLPVIQRESELVAAGQSAAPSFLDNDLFFAFAATYSGKSVDPLDLSDSFQAVRDDPEHRSQVLGPLDRARQEWALMMDDFKVKMNSNPAVAKSVRNLRFVGPDRPRPTYFVYLALARHMALNKLDLKSTDHVNDIMQIAVPFSYCHFVVLDKNWATAAVQIQKKLSQAKRLNWRAQILAKELDFLVALENWDPETADPQPYEPILNSV